MENVPPIMNGREHSPGSLPALDDLLRPTRRNAKASRPKHATPLALGYANASRDTHYSDSGLLTPPSSQQQGDIDATRMLISPPPEEMLQLGRNSTSRGRSIPLSTPQPPYTPSLLANPRASAISRNGSSKRKRQASSITSIRPLHGSTYPNNGDQAVVVGNETSLQGTTPNAKPRKQSKRNVSPAPPRSGAQHLSPYANTARPNTPTRSSVHSSSPKKRALVMSPHAANPNADYIIPSPVRKRDHVSAARRRSITPIPLYEPPRDRFTPPREVLYTSTSVSSPSISKSSKRKSLSTRRGLEKKLTLTLSIKKEPPRIDLSLPLPPASPTDDPLLLSGPPRRVKVRPKSASTYSRDTPSLTSTSPIASPHAEDSRRPSPHFDADTEMSDLSVCDDPLPPPAFNFDYVNDDADTWSDSDDDEFDQTGEYTGKYKVLSVPTKADPPSSCSRDRMEAWGRPISPFPRYRGPRLGSLSPSDRVEAISSSDSVDFDEPDPTPMAEEVLLGSSVASNRSLGYGDINDGTTSLVPYGDVYGSNSRYVANHEAGDSVVDVATDANMSPRVGDGPIVHDVVASSCSPLETSVALDDDAFSQMEKAAPRISLIREYSPDIPRDEEDDAEEEFVYRELSREPEPNGDDGCIPEVGNLSDVTVAVPEDDDNEISDDEVGIVDQQVIQISSDDPVAAARAAAILTMHNYDCLPHNPAKRLNSHSQKGVESAVRAARRRSAMVSGITKHSSTFKRRHTLGGIVGNMVFIPGSPVVSLPQLLKETEVTPESSKRGTQIANSLPIRGNPFVTPVKTSNSEEQDFSELRSSGTNGLPHRWSKLDWKLLDACFTDERIAVGAQQESFNSALAEVDDINIENVVDRFVHQLGGPDVIARRPGFTRVDILRRAEVLQEKQRSGKVAPPTPTSQQSFSTALRSSKSNTRLQHSLDHIRNSHERSRTLSDVSDLNQYLYSSTRQVAVQPPHSCKEAPQEAPNALASALYPPTVSTDSSALTSGPASGRNMSVTKSESPSLAARVKGFLFSYMPTSASMPPVKRTVPQHLSLPPPPREVFEKPRPPVSTPQPKPAPRAIPPKDLVQLHSVPLTKPTIIPRASKRPQRLVELHPPPPLNRSPTTLRRARRSSGGSVKDLIQTFEELKETSAATVSFSGDRRVRNGGNQIGDGEARRKRPIWRP